MFKILLIGFSVIMCEIFTVFKTISAGRRIVPIALAVFIVYVSSCSIVIAEPRLVESSQFFFRQTMPKLPDSSIQDLDLRPQKVINIFRPIGRIRINIRKFLVKNGNNVFCGMVGLISPGKVFAEEIGSKPTNEHTSNCKKKTRYSVHSYYDFFKGGLLGICFGLLVMLLFYSTQRRDERSDA